MTEKQLARFIAKIRFEDRDDDLGECWIWTAGCTPNGYSKFRLGTQSVGGHRAAYEHWVGPIAKGWQIDHLCRLRSCVNPRHLEAVEPSTNVARGLLPLLLPSLKRGNTNGLGHHHKRPWTPEWRAKVTAALLATIAKKVQRATCQKGHLYDEQNTRWRLWADGRRTRECRTCNRLHYVPVAVRRGEAA